MADFEIKYRVVYIRYKLSHNLIEKISDKDVKEMIDLVMCFGGAAIVASGIVVAPIIAMAIAAIKLEMFIIRKVDKGKGVYIYHTGLGYIPIAIK